MICFFFFFSVVHTGLYTQIPKTLQNLMRNPSVKIQSEEGLCTSAWILVTDPAIPFSVLMLLELLFGELGPDPGALLHAESKNTSKSNF